MAYISVPRDLSKIKTKVLFNLTKRQLVCFGLAALIGVPSFFLLKSTVNTSLAALGMMFVMLPFFFLGMYEKDGMCRIIGKFHDRFRGSMEKQGIQFLLIAIDQGIQFAGAGKYDVVVINI